MDLGTPSRTEIKLGLIEARHGAEMNSACPCIDPLLGGQDPEAVVLPHGSHMCPQPGYVPAAHTPPASLSPQEAGAVCFHPWLTGLSHPFAPPHAVSLPRDSGCALKGSLQRGPACAGPAGPSHTQGLLLSQILGGWGQRLYCFSDPQTPPNALGIRSLSFPSSAPYMSLLFVTGVAPAPPPGEAGGGGDRELPVPPSPPPPYTQRQPLGQPGCGGSHGIKFRTCGPGASLPLNHQALPEPAMASHVLPPVRTVCILPDSLSGLPVLRGASQHSPNHSSQPLTPLHDP